MALVIVAMVSSCEKLMAFLLDVVIMNVCRSCIDDWIMVEMMIKC